MNAQHNDRKMRAWLWYVLAFIGGCVVAFMVQQTWEALTACNENFDMLNPAYLCRAPEASEWKFEPLRNILLEKIVELQKHGQIRHVSVYFRDLTHTARFGIGEYESFYPASLLKVPIMMAILHQVDEQPDLLNLKLSFSKPSQDIPNVEQPDETIKPHTPYTIAELLRRMIVFSDNTSKDLLVQWLAISPSSFIQNTFLDLDIADIMMDKKDFISVQAYGNLFAVLYNTGYLSDELSQYALELLSQTTFNRGIVAGLPAGTRVAHKYGIHILSKKQSQLHDCGIVFHPSTRYILCVMTDGSDVRQEASAIAEISRATFDYVTSFHFQNL